MNRAVGAAMDEWVEARMLECVSSVDAHFAEGGQSTPTAGLKLAEHVKSAASALPSNRKEAVGAVGRRLIAEAGPDMPIKVVGGGKGRYREPRNQLLHDVGTLLVGMAGGR